MKQDGAAAFKKGNEFAQGNELEFREYIDSVTGQRCVCVSDAAEGRGGVGGGGNRCVMCLIHTCGRTHSDVWHASRVCMT